MKTYRRKFAKRTINNSISKKKETRDGIVWDIDETNKTCYVKIQGSGTSIKAHYPRNQKTLPEWLRIGTAVRIRHREGLRGYIEVVGEGRAIPTPVSGDPLPDPGRTGDTILNGIIIFPTSPESNSIIIGSGWYRINGIEYYYQGSGSEYIVLGDTGSMGDMGDVGRYMGEINFELDDAPLSGYFRYDALAIGEDGVVDYLKGEETQTVPVKPTVAGEHVLIGNILRVGGDETIPIERIYAEYVTPIPYELSLTYNEDLYWSDETDYPYTNIVVTIKDVYGGNVVSPASGWNIVIKLLGGTGQVWTPEEGSSPTEAYQSLNTEHTTNVRYYRNQTEAQEISPLIQINVESETTSSEIITPIYSTINIVLHDSLGGVIS